MVFPPSNSPIIKLDNCGAKAKHMMNEKTENVIMIFVAIRYILAFLLYSSSVLYSLVSLLIASGIPADEIIKNTSNYDFWINENTNKYVRLSEWLNGKEPYSHD